jgi:hypothetical protein
MAVKTYKKGSTQKLSANFGVNEFACKGSSCGCSTVLVDDALVKYVQKIRDNFGKAVTITSGYRCVKHNKKVGGASASRHAKGQAADIKVDGIAPKIVAQYAESIGIKGIGLYETAKDGYFVHIDTRTTKSFWYGQKQEKKTTFGKYVPVVKEEPKTETPKKETGEKTMTQEQFNQMMNNWISQQATKEPGEWSKEDREWAEKNGIIKGTGAGMSYLAYCTREQMVAFLHRLFEMVQK